MEHVIDEDADVVIITETWLKSNTNEVTSAVKDYGYELYHNHRKDRAKITGGGVGVLARKTITIKQIKTKQFQSFEHTLVKCSLSDKSWLKFISIYRLHNEPMETFFEEITQLLETLMADKDKFIIAGDLNIHCDNLTDGHTKKLNELLVMCNLRQMIVGSTQREGHTLDLVIVKEDEIEISGINVEDVSLSDHFLISFNASCETSKSFYETITYRNIKQINKDLFRRELKNELDNISMDNELEIVMNQYNNKLLSLMNHHAPTITRRVKLVPSAPWFDNEYKELRRRKRIAERNYRNSHTEESKAEFKSLRKQTTNLAKIKKQEHFKSKIENAGNNQKELFSVVNKLLDIKQKTGLPTANSDKELATNFQQYFKEKIQNIRDSFTPVNSEVPINENVFEMVEFAPATEEELRSIISNYGISCSPEDPLHVNIVKEYTDILLPFWLDLVNLSLTTGSMECMKSAVITPLLKDLDDLVDTETYKNYRPVSNLVFISKLVERCVATRLDLHMETNELNSKYAYGYKKGHSPETLLMNVTNDILEAFDNKQATVMLLLDLSAAFDTVDQDKLLDILHNEIGIRGTCFKWFTSFLKNRTQRVKINDSFSDSVTLDFGVAQGTVLGPRCYNIYSRIFPEYVRLILWSIFGFADDNQLYKHFVPIYQTQVLGSDINTCLQHVSTWMNKNYLRLNQSKTKILVLAPPSIMPSIYIHGTKIDDGCVRFTECAKILEYGLTKT